MSVPSMRDRLHLMQLIRSGVNPAELLKEACKPQEEEINREMQTTVQSLISKQGEIQQMFVKALAEQTLADPTHSAKAEIAKLQNQVTEARNGGQKLQQELHKDQKNLVETEQKVKALTGDLAQLRTALQGVGSSRYEKLALQVNQELSAGHLKHWHPEAPKLPRKIQ